MEILKIHSFLTHPGKGITPKPTVSSASIPLTGRLYTLLSGIFNSTDKDCKIPISFISNGDNAENEVRDEIIDIAHHQTLTKTKKLARRLQNYTTATSGKGLLFVVIGKDKYNIKIVISRFPADEGIVAESKNTKLKVEFVEQLFLKNANSYKAVVYKGKIKAPEFWDGSAIDRQMSNSIKEVADYWVHGFLQSDLKTSPVLGTQRLADTLRKALTSTTSIIVKQEITASLNLTGKLGSKATSIRKYCSEFGFSKETKAAIIDKASNKRLLDDQFKFHKSTFEQSIKYRYIELDNGVMIGADAFKFDETVTSRKIGEGDQIEYTTKGIIVDEKLKKSK